MFTGHVQDTGTPFMYMNARYYEPGVARFLTPDSYTGNPYNPNTQNVYSYTGGNPVNYVDPTGHFAIAITLGIGALLLLGGAAIIATSNPVEEPPPSIDFKIPSLKERLAFVYVTSSVLAYMARDAVFGSEETEQSDENDSVGPDASEGDTPITPDELEEGIKDWLGDDADVITNEAGDKIFVSKDGTRRVRFDINNTSPHNNPHGHVEEYINGRWIKPGPLYPSDVPQN